MKIKLNIATERFVDELKVRKSVRGIILFGSWARGNPRPNSDVDLMVILDNGFKRAVENHYGQIFEIIYTTSASAIKYWNEHLDEAARLWDIAQPLYDKDGTIKDLEKQARGLIAKCKPHINQSSLEQLLFDAKDQLEYAKYISTKGDMTTANMIISNKAFALAQLYFDINRMWVPSPKQLLETIKNEDNDLYYLFENFYVNESPFAQKIDILNKIIELIFHPINHNQDKQ
jgi:predicted nucleotidyltransferase